MKILIFDIIFEYDANHDLLDNHHFIFIFIALFSV